MEETLSEGLGTFYSYLPLRSYVHCLHSPPAFEMVDIPRLCSLVLAVCIGTGCERPATFIPPAFSLHTPTSALPSPPPGSKGECPSRLHSLLFALSSRNEDLEEIASTDLKYLMVPAFQGALTMKQVNPSKRLDHLQWAREHFLNYLIQCQYYHVAEFELPKAKNNSTDNTASSSMAYPSLADMASQRQAKIERWVNSYNLRTAQWQCCWGGGHVLGGGEGNSGVCHSFGSY